MRPGLRCSKGKSLRSPRNEGVVSSPPSDSEQPPVRGLSRNLLRESRAEATVCSGAESNSEQSLAHRAVKRGTASVASAFHVEAAA